MYTRFQEVEQEYFKLRGQFSLGRLSAAEFDAALHNLMVQDEQGRMWMIGANTGDWYYSEGGAWLAGNPFQSTTVTPAPVEIGDVPPPRFETVEPEPEPRRGLALPFIASGIILLLVAGVAFFLFNVDSIAPTDSAVLPTRINPPTFVAVQPAALLSPTPTQTLTPQFTAEPGATLIPITLTPPAIVLEPTDTAPVLSTIPTVTPGVFTGPVDDGQGDFNDTVFNPPTPEPAQPGGLAPDVYITDIRVSPNPPHQRESIAFTATFLNTNPQNVGMEWRIVMLDPGKSGRNKDWGESQLAGITIPPGTHEYTLEYIPVTSGGPCVDLQALVARRLEDNGRFIFHGTNGAPYAKNLRFC